MKQVAQILKSHPYTLLLVSFSATISFGLARLHTLLQAAA